MMKLAAFFVLALVACTNGLDYANWMAGIKSYIYQYSLLDITLPGTHDSGTYYLGDAVAPGSTSKDILDLIHIGEDVGIPIYEFIRKWSVTQNQTFYEQLCSGIRYLDIRSVYYKNDWYTAHFLVGNPTRTLLNDVATFMTSHPGEVVVLQIGNLDGLNATTEGSLAALINNTVGKWLVSETANLSTTIGELVAMNKRVFMLSDSTWFAQKHKFLLATDDHLEGSYANSDNLARMTEWNTQEINEQGGHDKLFSLSWTLTIQTSDILESLYGRYKYPNLKSMSILADLAFPSFVSQYKNYSLGNLVLVDWFQYANVVDYAISTNMRTCHDNYKYIARQANGQYCRDFAEEGLCMPSSANYTFVKENCKLSCGFC